MNNKMKDQKCICSIIPPHIMDELKKHESLELITENYEIDIHCRVKRSLMKISPVTVIDDSKKGKAERIVYDCMNTVKLQHVLKMSEKSISSDDPIVSAVFKNAGIIRNFYREQFNFDSVDNHGCNIILNVHYSKRFDNAFWDGHEMIFGDGDGVIFTNFANSLDVTGHELSHGIVQHTAGLVYEGEPGALNEHYADVFGITIRQYHENQTSNPKSANWLIGDTIMGPSFKGQAIRSMKAPGTAYNNSYLGKDPQPDNMKGYYSGTSDNNGVHINSGIPNKLFYLVSVGFNDTLKAAHLWFNTLKTMKPKDDFALFRTRMLKTVQSKDMKTILPKNALSIVTESFKAVGLS